MMKQPFREGEVLNTGKPTHKEPSTLSDMRHVQHCVTTFFNMNTSHPCTKFTHHKMDYCLNGQKLDYCVNGQKKNFDICM